MCNNFAPEHVACNFFAPASGATVASILKIKPAATRCPMVGCHCFWQLAVCPKAQEAKEEGPRPEEGLIGAILFGELGVDFVYET